MKIVLWFSAVLASAFYLTGPVLDPDLWWHIAVGRWVIHNQQVPVVDYWNMFWVGQSWLAYSWSNEILFALVDRSLENHGLLGLKLILAFLISFSFCYCLSRLSGDWFLGTVLGIFTFAACASHFTLRPQSIVWIYFIWLIYFADRIEGRGLRFKEGVAVFGLAVLWANSHLTTVFGLGVLVLWVLQRGRVSLAVKAGALFFLGTLLTPYFGSEWLLLFEKSSHPLKHSMIVEFQAATLTNYVTGMVVMLAAVLLGFLYYKPMAVSVGKLLLAGAFTFAGLAFIKFMPFAAISISAAIAILWRNAGQDTDKDLGKLGEGFQRLKQLILRIPVEGLSFVIICIAIVNVYQLWKTPLDLDVTPVQAVDFIQEQNLSHPILNTFGSGGYLIYRFSDNRGNPEHLVAIDGRTNVIPEHVWTAYHAARVGSRNWFDFVELVKPKTILWTSGAPFVTLLLSSGEWCEVFQSGSPVTGFSVLIKREEFDAREGDFLMNGC